MQQVFYLCQAGKMKIGPRLSNPEIKGRFRLLKRAWKAAKESVAEHIPEQRASIFRAGVLS
jgi:hypothetical protein